MPFCVNCFCAAERLPEKRDRQGRSGTGRALPLDLAATNGRKSVLEHHPHAKASRCGPSVANQFRNRIPPRTACRKQRVSRHLRLRAECAPTHRSGNPKIARSFRGKTQFLSARDARSGFPRTGLCRWCVCLPSHLHLRAVPSRRECGRTVGTPGRHVEAPRAELGNRWCESGLPLIAQSV